MPDDCIFCQILAGELPAQKIDENESAVAFLDINPWTRGHSVVVPRRHSRNLYDIPEDDLASISATAKRIALRVRDRLGCDGVNLLNSAEPAAWQTIFHFHMHVIPRYDGDPLELPIRPKRASDDELASVAAELR